MAEPESPAKADSACLVCRSRKVRCDRTPPRCQNCNRLGVLCPGFEGSQASPTNVRQSVDGIYKASGVEKRRIGSCDECRRSKRKCSQGRPVCRRCAQLSLRCHYPSKRLERQHSEAPLSSSPSVASPDAASLPQRRQASVTTSSSHAWLYRDALPSDGEQLRLLVTIYFDRLHPLRCLGFVHKPSFMLALDKNTVLEEFGEHLVHIICALGALFFYQDRYDQEFSDTQSVPGAAWAEKARDGVLRDIGRPSTQTLMAMVLFCEYAMRTGQHALAFMLTASCYRIVRLLGLDSEVRARDREALKSLTETESERRLLWSCYTLDSFIGSGVDGNLHWRDEAPHVPLPCSENDFVSQTRPLIPQLYLTDVVLDSSYPGLSDLRSNIIVLARFRTQVLQLIRRPQMSVEIWHTHSPFLRLIQELQVWYNGLPDPLLLTNINTYVQKEMNILGAVYMLHCTYNQTVADLTRISLPGFDFPLASAFRTAPESFRRQCQDRCRYHADEVSSLILSGFRAGVRAFDDAHIRMAAFESSKIQIVHTTTATPNTTRNKQKAYGNIMANMRLLSCMHFDKQTPNHYIRALMPLLAKFGFDKIVSEWREAANITPDEAPEVTGPADSNYLSNLHSFRLARTEVEAARGESHRIQDPYQPVGGSINDSFVVSQPPLITPSNALTPQLEILPNQQHEVTHTAGLPLFAEDAASLESSAALDPAVEEYIRLADEMSNFFTWDASDYPAMNYTDPYEFYM